MEAPLPPQHRELVSAEAAADLQLLLFVDKRPQSSERIRQVRHYLRHQSNSHRCELQVIDIGEQPYLAEHFKLVATPALIKSSPEPRQTLTGTNLIEQLEAWWPRWLHAIDESKPAGQPMAASSNQSAAAQSGPVQPEAQPSSPAQSGSAQSGSAQSGSAQSNSTPPGPDQPGAAQPSIVHEAELIRLSDELFRVTQEKANLEAQLHFKDRLIAMLAHDLRNPLTALSIALETLEMGFEDGSETSTLKPDLQAQLLHHGRTQTKAIDRMITDILQAARGSHARFQIHPIPLDFTALLTNILDRLKRQFHGKSQQVEIDLPTDLPQVHTDPELSRQLVINLLDNAIKYTPVGGTISVSALHRTTQKIQVSICDTGPGIPEENQQRIFEDRFRLKRDEAKDGYGIGLSLCQRIVRAHYGQIWVDSEINQGSCFHFTLPVYR
ncbi:MAG: histidine kinase [Elainellaceae cyanobacterium]